MKRLRGFTIVELLVVIAVIGILTTITVVGYNRYQQNSRDAQRQAKVTAIAEALEKYYDANGEYPGCSQLTASGVTGTGGALQGVEATALVAPTASSGTTNSIACNYLTSPSAGAPATCANMSSAGWTDDFAYVGDCSPTCLTGNSCLGFKLEYMNESTGQVSIISSRHTTNFNTSGSISNLVATPDSTNGFSTMNLTWTAVPNTVSYTVEYSTNNFATYATLSPSPTSASATISSLSMGTTYQFRVEPIANDNSSTGWTTVTGSTWSFPAPTLSAGTIGPNSLQFSWNSVAHATSYTYTVATDSGFTNLVGGTPSTTPATSQTISGLTVGQQYYIKVDATAAGGAVDSGPSTPISMTTTVPTPTCTASTLNSNTQATITWNSVSVANTYTLQYSPNSNFSGATTLSNLTGTSKAVTGLTNGTKYYFQVEALVGSTPSTYGACPTTTTGVDGPVSYGWSADGYAVRAGNSGSWMTYPGSGSYHSEGMTISGSCGGGATVVVELQAYYALTNNTSVTSSVTMGWTLGAQDRFFEGGTGSYRVWWNGWVACDANGIISGSVYLGNAGPYT